MACCRLLAAMETADVSFRSRRCRSGPCRCPVGCVARGVVRVAGDPLHQRPAGVQGGLPSRCGMGARCADRAGVRGQPAPDAGASGGAGAPWRARARGRAACAVLWALRRAAARAAGAVAQPAVRAAAGGRAARQALRRARGGRRQGAVHDVPGGAARLEGSHRRHTRSPDGADRGRGGGRLGQFGAVPAGECRRAWLRCRADQRYRHVGRGHAGGDHPAAWHAVHPDYPAGAGQGPAFRPVRRFRAEPDQCADADSRRPCR